MEPTAFETSSVSDSQGLAQDVSTEPFCKLSPESKFKTEEFLRHESGFSHTESPPPSAGAHDNTVAPNDIENKSSVSNPAPEPDSLKSMETSGEKLIPPLSEGNPENNPSDLPENQPAERIVDDRTEVIAVMSAGEGDADNKLTGDSESPQPIEVNPDMKVDHIVPNSDVTLHSKDKTSLDPEMNVEVKEANVEEKEEWLDILGSGHLLKKILKPGEPDSRPNKSDICVLSYTGQLEDGTVVETAENVKIHLSDNEVIQGIDFALALMNKGEEAEVKVGPRFAYGSLGRQPNIPPGSTLLYTIKLIDVQEEPQIQDLPINERISYGQKKKERGNYWYSRDEHSIAINCYRRALEFLDDINLPEQPNEEDTSKLLDERLKTYNNLTASQMKIHAYDAALMSVNYVLTSQPQNVKALFRKSKILKEKGDIPEAIKVVRLALSFDKDSKSLQQELSALLAVQRKDNSKQRELYKKMMGTSSSQEKDSKSKSSRNYSTIKWTSLLAFAAVVVAGTVALKYKM